MPGGTPTTTRPDVLARRPARPLAILRLALAVSLLAIGATSCSDDAQGASADPSPSGPPVVRTVLASGDPAAAPGRVLELVRYTIAPGTRLPAHRHPGMQLALVQSGTLTYTVIAGEVMVHEPDGGTRTIGPGETATIVAGEWIAEHERVEHFGENGGEEPVVILASSLLESGEPSAIVTER